MPLFQKKQSSENTPKKSSIPFGGEKGYTGTQFFSGLISDEEYLQTLRWQDGVDVFDKMRRSDGQVKGVLQAIMLPIRQAQWTIASADESEQSTKDAYDLEDNIIKGKNCLMNWDDMLRQILTYLVFGFSIFEKVYHIVDGKVYLKKLAPRLQKTLWRWHVDEYGELKGIQQYVLRPTGKTEYIDIPAEKLIVFTNELEGSNYEGVSLLRSAYKHWYIKDELYKVDALAHDRFSTGVPWAKEPIGANPQDKERAETVLSNLHSREKSYMIVPNGWDIGIFEKAGTNDSLIKSIQHHNEEIAKNVLAQFINLGTTESGSRALGGSFIELFMMSINAVAGYVADQLNNTVIKELCDYNYTIKDGKYPRLQCGRIMLDVNSFLSSIKLSREAGAFNPDIDTENHVRKLLGLSEITEDEEIKDEGVKENEDEVADDKEAGKVKENETPDSKSEEKPEKKMHEHCKHTHILREYKREQTEVEKKCCDIEKIEYAFDEGAKRNLSVLEKIRERQIKEVAKQAITKDPAEIRAPYVGEMSKLLYDEMEKTYSNGKADLRNELKKQIKQGEIKLAETVGDANMMKLVRDRARAGSVAIANKLVNNALFQKTRVPIDATESEAIEQLVVAMRDTGAKELERFAAAMANYAYGLGREEVANENEDEIEYAVYSAILDDRVCENCLPKDMVEHDIDDMEFATPSPDCLGGEGNCRCVNVYKMKGMEGDFATKSKSDYERDKNAVAEGDLDAKKMRARYELPKYTEPE